MFLSGFSSLAYQSALFRAFTLIFGTSTAATAAVMGVFVAGLGLGAIALGEYIDRDEAPLLVYARLEGAIGALLLLTPTLMRLVDAAYIGLARHVAGGFAITFVRVLLCGATILPVTFLAGGTLGAAARAIETDSDPFRTRTSILYGVNTLGATLGCAAATFVLLERLGGHATILVAGAVDLVVAALAVTVSRRAEVRGDGRTRRERRERKETYRFFTPLLPLRALRDRSSPRISASLVVPLTAAIAGFSFFLMELVWYRMLAPILGGTVYTFGLILAVALAGIGLGGAAYAFRYRTRAVASHTLAITCLLESMAMLLPFIAGDRLALLAYALRPAAGAPLGAYLPGWILITSIVAGPAFVAGLQFPVLIALAGRGREDVAHDVGLVFVCNTAGAVAGCAAGGFGLLPAVSAPGCWKLAAALLFVAGVIVLTVARDKFAQHLKRIVVAGAAALLVLCAAAVADGPTAVWRHSEIGVGRASIPLSRGQNAIQEWVNDTRRSIVWERDGVESTVALQQIAALSFVVNGKVDGNARNDAPTQVMSGLLAALLHPQARRALVIGLGTGSTAGWLGRVPDVERTDVIELEPAVREVARRSAAVNQHVLDNRKVHIAYGDARELLATGRGGYDLIVSEPSNPYRAGVASLFTREFYETISSRLDEDGVFLQWLQAYQTDSGTARSIIASLRSVFPYVELWQVHRADLALIASRHPIAYDTAALRARITQEPFASALGDAWRASALEDVLARYVAGPALADSILKSGARLNTDDRNFAEFAFAREVGSGSELDINQLRASAKALDADRPPLQGFAGAVDWNRVAHQRSTIYVIAGSMPSADHDEPGAQPRNEALRDYITGDLVAAVKALQAVESQPEGDVDVSVFAEGLAEQGDTAAVPYIKELEAIDLTEAEAAAARLAFRRGRDPIAESALVSSLVHYRTDPWASQVSMARALALADELSAAHPDMVPALYDAVSQSFAVAALERPRRLTAIGIASHAPGWPKCLDALEPLEPLVPWRRDVLQFRATCYAQFSSDRLPQARRDLSAFDEDAPREGR